LDADHPKTGSFLHAETQPEFKIARVVIDAEIGLFADLVVKELCGHHRGPRGKAGRAMDTPALPGRQTGDGGAPVARGTRASAA
jgi:hypothetical protein